MYGSETVFLETLKNAGLSFYFFELAKYRYQSTCVLK